MYLTGIADFRREEIRPIYSGKEEKLWQSIGIFDYIRNKKKIWKLYRGRFNEPECIYASNPEFQNYAFYCSMQSSSNPPPPTPSSGKLNKKKVNLSICSFIMYATNVHWRSEPTWNGTVIQQNCFAMFSSAVNCPWL
jgi:hypothetical protein